MHTCAHTHTLSNTEVTNKSGDTLLLCSHASQELTFLGDSHPRANMESTESLRGRQWGLRVDKSDQKLDAVIRIKSLCLFQKYNKQHRNSTRALLTTASLTICLATCSGLQTAVVSEISRVSRGWKGRNTQINACCIISLRGPDLQIITISYLQTISYVLSKNQIRFSISFYLWNTSMGKAGQGSSCCSVARVAPVRTFKAGVTDSVDTEAGPCLRDLSHHSASLLTRLPLSK